MIVSKSEAEAVCSQTGACTVGSLERRTGGRLYYIPYLHCSEVGITGLWNILYYRSLLYFVAMKPSIECLQHYFQLVCLMLCINFFVLYLLRCVGVTFIKLLSHVIFLL